MKKGWLILVSFCLFLVLLTIYIVVIKPDNTKRVNIVSSQSVWGNIAEQIGGNKISVSSIVSDPNADPHEYETSARDARNIAGSNLVIINGLGYDAWANKLIAANPAKHRTILNLGSSLGLKIGDNPHIWYSMGYTKASAALIAQQIINQDPENRQYYLNNLQVFNNHLDNLIYLEKGISLYHAGDKVASTESLFSYMAKDMKLNIVTPLKFMQAVSEGNGPTAGNVATFIDQINNKDVKILVYNLQTETPVTTNMKSRAASKNIPVVGLTETLPSHTSYQDWMSAQIDKISKGLNK